MITSGGTRVNESVSFSRRFLLSSLRLADSLTVKCSSISVTHGCGWISFLSLLKTHPWGRNGREKHLTQETNSSWNWIVISRQFYQQLSRHLLDLFVLKVKMPMVKLLIIAARFQLQELQVSLTAEGNPSPSLTRQPASIFWISLSWGCWDGWRGREKGDGGGSLYNCFFNIFLSFLF